MADRTPDIQPALSPAAAPAAGTSAAGPDLPADPAAPAAAFAAAGQVTGEAPGSYAAVRHPAAVPVLVPRRARTMVSTRRDPQVSPLQNVRSARLLSAAASQMLHPPIANWMQRMQMTCVRVHCARPTSMNMDWHMCVAATVCAV